MSDDLTTKFASIGVIMAAIGLVAEADRDALISDVETISATNSYDAATLQTVDNKVYVRLDLLDDVGNNGASDAAAAVYDNWDAVVAKAGPLPAPAPAGRAPRGSRGSAAPADSAPATTAPTGRGRGRGAAAQASTTDRVAEALKAIPEGDGGAATAPATTAPTGRGRGRGAATETGSGTATAAPGTPGGQTQESARAAELRDEAATRQGAGGALLAYLQIEYEAAMARAHHIQGLICEAKAAQK